MRSAKHLVVLIGAGVSTAAGVPDFRGPSGIWTQEQAAKARQAGRKRGRDGEDSAWVRGGTVAAAPAVDLSSTAPTYTHHALVELARRDILKCLVTQNIDALEQRAGFPRHRLAIIHGCVCEERCAVCGARYLREGDVGGKSGAPPGRRCEVGGCGGELGATLLDWEDEWPADQAALADSEVGAADLCLVLGSSLRVEPAGSLPNHAKAFALVNLQETPKDKATKCALLVRAKTDVAMEAIMRRVCGVELVRGDAAEQGAAVEWREV